MKNLKLNPALFAIVALMGVASLNTGYAKSFEGKVEDVIDDASDALKKAANKMGDDFNAIQNYLDNYHWKGMIQDKATSGPVTLKHLQMNGHSRAVAVRPNEKIDCYVDCSLDREKCAAFGLYRVVIGIKGVGPQTTIGNELGLVAGDSREHFTIDAPAKSGVYQVRFRLVDAVFRGDAIQAWGDEKGNEPDGTTTIGVIYVK